MSFQEARRAFHCDGLLLSFFDVDIKRVARCVQELLLEAFLFYFHSVIITLWSKGSWCFFFPAAVLGSQQSITV